MWFYDIDWELTLKYVQAYLSWPPLAAVVLGCFIWKFGASIRTFLENVRPDITGTQPMPVQRVDLPSRPETEEERPPAATAAEAAEDAAAVEAEKEAEFRYLNELLVVTTQNVLDTIRAFGALPLVSYAMLFGATPAEQRQAMLSVLYQHDLAAIDGEDIRLTPKGQEYVAWQPRQDWVRAQNVVMKDLTIPPETAASAMAKMHFGGGTISIPKDFRKNETIWPSVKRPPGKSRF